MQCKNGSCPQLQEHKMHTARRGWLKGKWFSLLLALPAHTFYRNAKGIQTTKDRLACPAGPLYPHPQCHLSFHPPYSQSFRKTLCGQSSALTTLLPRTIAFLPARSYFCLHCPMTIFSRKTSSFQMCCPRPSRALCHIIWGGCLHLGRKGFFHPAI